MESLDKKTPGIDPKIILKEDVGKLYDVPEGKVRIFFHRKMGIVDLNAVSLKQAEALASEGILVPKKSAPKAAASGKE